MSAGEGRTAYVVTPYPHVTQKPSAHLHTAGPGDPFAVIDLGESQVHVFTAAQARGLAEAFARAASLLDAQEAARAAPLEPSVAA
jgi:hypothetical protein